MIGALLSLIFCLLTVSATAQTDGSFYSGYRYPADGSSCSPICTGVKATIQVPAGVTSPPTASFLAWIALQDTGSGGGCTGGTAPCLGQFGVLIQSFVGGNAVWEAWWELVPGTSITPISMTVSGGDVIDLQMTCATNCTASNPSQTWDVIWANRTNGQSVSLNLSWPLKMTRVYAVVETISGNVADYGVQRFANVQVQQNGVFSPMPLLPVGALYDITGAPTFTSDPSAPLNTSDFAVCKVASTSSFSQCNFGPYSNLPGAGP